MSKKRLCITLGAVWLLVGTLTACKKAHQDDSVDAAPSAALSVPVAPVETPSASAAQVKLAPPVSINPPGSDQALKSCCAALHAEAPKAAANEKAAFEAAASVCDGMTASVKSGSIKIDDAKRTVRAQVQRVHSIPGACR